MGLEVQGKKLGQVTTFDKTRWAFCFATLHPRKGLLRWLCLFDALADKVGTVAVADMNFQNVPHVLPM